MIWLILIVLATCAAVAGYLVAVGVFLVGLIVRLWRHFHPPHSGEYLDGRELDPRDPIDRAMLAGREAAERERNLRRDVEVRAWR